MILNKVFDENETTTALIQFNEEKGALLLRVRGFKFASLQNIVLPEDATIPPYADVDKE